MPVNPEQGDASLPTVTIVIISYNHGRFLEACLDSVRAQTYPKIELFIVDNNSADGSSGVIERFAAEAVSHPNLTSVTPLLLKENLHLTGAMIEGFQRASGAYLVFVDGDDLLLPHCIEAHVKAHLASMVPVGVTSVDMYQARGDEVVVSTSLTYARFILSGAGQKRRFCRMANLAAFRFPDSQLDLDESTFHFVDRSMVREWVWSATSGLCFRREAVELMFSRRPRLGAGTDNYLARGIAAITGSITIDRPLAIYRLHGSNMFSKHPALNNLVSFNKTQLATSDTDVSVEIVECMLLQAKHLAERLEIIDTYIEAIDLISRVGPGLPSQGHSSYTRRFLGENKNLLTDAFGTRVYSCWVRRYTKITDILGLARKRARRPAVPAARH